MSNKIELLKKYIQTADLVYDENGQMFEPTYGDNHSFHFLNVADPDDNLVIVISELENAYFDGGDLVINEKHLTFRKTSDIPVPIELLSTTQLEEVFEEIADECDGLVRYGYSGRGMYGSQCYGIVTNRPSEAIDAGREHGLTGHRQDSMGLEYIVYWPRMKYEKPAESENE